MIKDSLLIIACISAAITIFYLCQEIHHRSQRSKYIKQNNLQTKYSDATAAKMPFPILVCLLIIQTVFLGLLIFTLFHHTKFNEIITSLGMVLIAGSNASNYFTSRSQHKEVVAIGDTHLSQLFGKTMHDQLIVFVASSIFSVFSLVAALI